MKTYKMGDRVRDSHGNTYMICMVDWDNQTHKTGYVLINNSGNRFKPLYYSNDICTSITEETLIAIGGIPE